MMNDKSCCKICPLSFGVAIGGAKALYMMFIAWVGLWFGYGLPLITHISTFIHGYAPTFVGGLWGGLYGFIDGFIFGFIAAFIYNLCVGCRSCKKE